MILKQVVVCLCLLVAVACGGEDSPTAPTPTPTPDLVVGSPTVDYNNPAGGATFTLSTTVQNAGDGAAAATTLRYFRSTDATITTDDTAEGSVAVEELSPSGNTSASVQLTAPGTGGTYYYGACVDAVTDESNTANNCSSSVQVTVRQPTEGVPPFVGVEWLTPGIIDVSDPSWLRSVTYAGRGERILWDHVQQDWVMRNVFLFNVKYEGRQGLTEVQVHPGYGDEASAREQVELYAPVLGRLPRVLLSNAKEVEIQSEPTNPYSATANQAGIFHINTYFAEDRLSRGLLEETLIHEAGHVSLDLNHARSPRWQAAQRADGVFINNYAQDFPEREDIAESILAYFAVMYRPYRISTEDRNTILDAIPNRFAYFDEQRFDMSPYVRVATVPPSVAWRTRR